MIAMKHIQAGTIAIAAMLVLTAPAFAARHHKRVYSETGPLIMSGSMVPASSPHRSRAPDICKPVVIKRRPMFSMLPR
jgi:hypothetical protein